MDLLSIFHGMSLEQRGQFLEWLRTGERPANYKCILAIQSPDGTVEEADQLGWRNRFLNLGLQFEGDELVELGLSGAYFHGIRRFTHFLENTPWFRRTWTFQESVMGQEPLIIYGSYSRSWDVLYRACQFMISGTMATLQGSGWIRDDGFSIAESVVKRGNYRRDFAMLQVINGPTRRCTPLWWRAMADQENRRDFLKQWRLKALLPELRPTCATEPVDKVLALTSFAHDDGRKIMFPNHKSEVKELYLTVAKYWMTTVEDCRWSRSMVFAPGATVPLAYSAWPCPLISDEPNLSFLNHVQISERKSPSWVPDWSCPLEAMPLIDCKGLCASESWKAQAKMDDSALCPQLDLKGLHLMTIEVVSADPEAVESHTEMIRPFPDPYPTTTLTYVEAYVRITSPIDPGQIQPPDCSSRSPGFWEYLGQHEPRASKTADLSETSHGQYTTQDLNIAFLPRHRFGARNGNERSHYTGRALFASTTGFLGLAPRSAVPGDEIYIIAGARVPFVLRKKQDGTFRILGECYTFGLMHGEALTNVPSGRIEDVVLT